MANNFFPPWQSFPLNEWTIVGMNHYTQDGQRRLFVAMTKDGWCIQEEGDDDEYLWNRLWKKAVAVNDPSKIGPA